MNSKTNAGSLEIWTRICRYYDKVKKIRTNFIIFINQPEILYLFHNGRSSKVVNLFLVLWIFSNCLKWMVNSFSFPWYNCLQTFKLFYVYNPFLKSSEMDCYTWLARDVACQTDKNYKYQFWRLVNDMFSS